MSTAKIFFLRKSHAKTIMKDKYLGIFLEFLLWKLIGLNKYWFTKKKKRFVQCKTSKSRKIENGERMRRHLSIDSRTRWKADGNRCTGMRLRSRWSRPAGHLNVWLFLFSFFLFFHSLGFLDFVQIFWGSDAQEVCQGLSNIVTGCKRFWRHVGNPGNPVHSFL